MGQKKNFLSLLRHSVPTTLFSETARRRVFTKKTPSRAVRLQLLETSKAVGLGRARACGAGRARPAGVRHALSLLSWNLLAPPYKRPKETEAASRARASAQIEVVRRSAADVVGLQEFWLAEQHLGSWQEFAMKEGYFMLVSPRTGGKKDCCCMLVRAAAAGLLSEAASRWWICCSRLDEAAARVLACCCSAARISASSVRLAGFSLILLLRSL